MHPHKPERYLTYTIDAARGGDFDGRLDRVIFDTKTRTATLAYQKPNGRYEKKRALEGTWMDDPLMPRFDITNQAFDSDRNGVADIGTAAIVEFRPDFLLASQPDSLAAALANTPAQAVSHTHAMADTMVHDALRPLTDKHYDPYEQYWVGQGIIDYMFGNVDANRDTIEDAILLEENRAPTLDGAGQRQYRALILLAPAESADF